MATCEARLPVGRLPDPFYPGVRGQGQPLQLQGPPDLVLFTDHGEPFVEHPRYVRVSLRQGEDMELVGGLVFRADHGTVDHPDKVGIVQARGKGKAHASVFEDPDAHPHRLGTGEGIDLLLLRLDGEIAGGDLEYLPAVQGTALEELFDLSAIF